MFIKKFKRCLKGLRKTGGILFNIHRKHISDRVLYTCIICFIQMSYMCTVLYRLQLFDIWALIRRPKTHIQNINERDITRPDANELWIYGGLFIQHLNKRWTMMLALVLMSAAVITIPYSAHIPQLYACFWAFGFGSGVYVNVKYVWLIDMWQESSAPILHLAGFMFGIGHTFGPFIEKPYLTGDQFAGLT
ncbi:unnamed protein product, partial [Medioppia subpectinata]